VQRLNRRYQRTGTLWEGRYRACLVQNDSYFMTCQRYIELNPVRALMVPKPGDYAYSSYAHHAWGSSNSLLSTHACYEALHRQPEARPRAYRALFEDEFSEEDLNTIRIRTNACSVIGNDQPTLVASSVTINSNNKLKKCSAANFRAASAAARKRNKAVRPLFRSSGRTLRRFVVVGSAMRCRPADR